jgi:hypothetical protein
MKKMISLMLLFLAIGLLSGCGTPPARHLVEECQRTTPAASGARWDCLQRASSKTDEIKKQEYVQGLVSRCESFGYQKGSPTFNQCVYQQNQIEIQNNAAAESLRIQQQQLGMQQMQQGLQMLNPPGSVRPPITCTKMPGSFTTTCQ